MNESDCLQIIKEVEDMVQQLVVRKLGVAAQKLNLEDLTGSSPRNFKTRTAQVVATDASPDAIVSEIFQRDLQRIFGQIIDNTGFIHEAKLWEILSEVRQEDSRLICFSNVLKVIIVKYSYPHLH